MVMVMVVVLVIRIMTGGYLSCAWLPEAPLHTFYLSFVYASTICGELSKAGSNGTITTATSIKLSALGSSMLR